MHLYTENGRHHGWFDKDSAIQVTKGLRDVIYGLACSDKKPDNIILPCFFENTFYIGMSGGMYHDKKNKMYPGGIQMNATKRLLSHNKHLYNPKTPIEKYQLFHKQYNLFEKGDPDLRNHDLQIWYSISTPDKEANDIMSKSFLHLVEDEFIYFYAKKFGYHPIMNLDHKSNSPRIKNKQNSNSKRVNGSLSQRVMEGNTLCDFFVAQTQQ